MVDVIHIGFPKTATTYIQDMFNAFPEIYSIAKPSKNPEIRALVDELISTPPLEFNAEYFKAEFNKICSGTEGKGKIKLLSHELLSGDMYSGKDTKLLADRIFAVFGKVQIVMTIREQVATVESLYRYYVMIGGPLCIQDFIYKMNSPCVDVFGKSSIFSKYKYDHIIEYYQKLFGENNVAVVPFELLFGANHEYERTFFEKCGVKFRKENLTPKMLEPSNTDLSNASLGLNRLVNNIVATHMSNGILSKDFSYYMCLRVFPKTFHFLDKFLKKISSNKDYTDQKKVKFLFRIAGNLLSFLPESSFIQKANEKLDLRNKNSIKDELKKVYADSNARTEMLTGLNLRELGYTCNTEKK
ncbi:hypothetical protein [Maridesulfovibrio sp.]|uniref:hypothetical protein n=1 Tax=Maridesulfovibrio sp. TaxID=2795000 RepID=UPI003BAC0B72